MKYEIKPSSRFKRDMKLAKKRGYDQRLIENVIRTLCKFCRAFSFERLDVFL